MLDDVRVHIFLGKCDLLMSTRIGAVLSVQLGVDELVQTAKLHWTLRVYGFGEVVGELGAVDVRLVPGDLRGIVNRESVFASFRSYLVWESCMEDIGVLHLGIHQLG